MLPTPVRRLLSGLVVTCLAACGASPSDRARTATQPAAPSAPPAQSAPAATADDAVLADVRSWLSHPNEYGRPPRSVAIVWRDTRKWPFHDAPVRVYLVAYDMGDRTGVALAGPVTWSFIEDGTFTFAPLDHAQLATLYAGWYLAASIINDERGRAAQQRATPDPSLAATLRGHGLQDVEILDRLVIGDTTYVAARARRDGAAVIAVGQPDEPQVFDAADPVMSLPLFWYLGDTFSKL